MKILFTFLISTFLSLTCYGQLKGYKITKKNGTSFYVKNYRSKKTFLKLILNNGKTENLNYSELDNIQYERKVKRKKTVKITKQFVRISERNGMLMERIVNGKCKMYTYSTIGEYSNTFYYVYRENEKIATELGSINLLPIKNYKKKAIEYFTDCPIVIKKIKKKFRKRKIEELVEFYNTNCL
jgi:hypothetical protein